MTKTNKRRAYHVKKSRINEGKKQIAERNNAKYEIKKKTY